MKYLLNQLAHQGDIDWLSYYFAQFISEQANTDIDDLLALSAALVSEANLAGDVCIDLAQLQDKPLFNSSRFDFDIPRGIDSHQWMTHLATTTVVGSAARQTPLILDDQRLYLHRYWHYENQVAAGIRARLASEPVDKQALMMSIESLFADAKPEEQEQQNAVLQAVQQRFTVVSGGPGTGKTTTVVKILAALLTIQPDARIALAAPTGKAAARMMGSIQNRIDQINIDADKRSLIPTRASTLHRLLGYRQRHFQYDRDHRLAVDCVIVDEASMIDLSLMFHLLQALPDHARLILLGDRDQLASVSAGNVMGDITGHGRSLDQATPELAGSIALLLHSYRFEESGGIANLAQQVNIGDTNAALSLLDGDDESIHWQINEEEQLEPKCLDWILEAYQLMFEADSVSAALQHFEKTRVLSAINWGPLGVVELNQLISSKILAANQLPDSGRFHGMPIMANRNHYELGIFNGDTGILWQTSRGLAACFDDGNSGVREISLNRLSDFSPAWVTTVHKSQGSEFDSVLLILPGDAEAEVLSRELLYTAITRARLHFHLHAGRSVITQTIHRLTKRDSGLAAKLGWSD